MIPGLHLLLLATMMTLIWRRGLMVDLVPRRELTMPRMIAPATGKWQPSFRVPCLGLLLQMISHLSNTRYVSY